MMQPFMRHWAESLWNTSVQAGLACLLLWLVCKVFTKMPVLLRVWLWRGIALKFILGMVGLVPMGVEAATAGAQSTADSTRLPLYLFAASVGLMVIFWLKILVSMCKLRTLVISSQLCTDPHTRATVRDLAAQIGLSFVPDIRLCPALTVPMLVGSWRPALLLPESLDPTGFEFHPAVAHELAHAKHRDLSWNWLITLADSVFFFHPCIWLLKRELYFAQELACDIRAIHTTQTSKAAYSRMLARLPNVPERFDPAMSVGLASAYPALKRRILQLHHGERAWRGSAWMASIMFVLVLMPTWTLSLPRNAAPMIRTRSLVPAPKLQFSPAAAASVQRDPMEVK